jgi:AcrR family transcriptional regulator
MPKRAPASRPARRPRAKAAPAPERILEAALAAFAARGFDGASTREIAAAAGVPQGLVTYHFESKQALWEAAVDAVFRDLADELGGALGALQDVDPDVRWRAVVKRFVRFAARRPELHCLMTREGSHDGPRLRYLVDRHLRPLYEASTRLIRDAVPGVDAAHLHYVLIGAVAHLFAVAPEFERVTGRDPRTPAMVEAHANAVVDWVIAGALAGGAAPPDAKKRAGSRGR